MIKILKIISASWIATILCNALTIDIPQWLIPYITWFAIAILFDIFYERGKK